MDRENVKKGLQCIIDGTVRCESCGYSIDKHGHMSCHQECAANAIKLLKEQEAVEPTIDEYGNKRCGSCGHKLQSIADPDLFCCKCGRKVKWNA